MSTNGATGKPGTINRGGSHVDEYHARQLALQHAVTTHADTVDENQVVVAAKAYLAFLTNSLDDAAAG